MQQEFRKLAVGSFSEVERMFSSSPEVKNELSQTGISPGPKTILFLCNDLPDQIKEGEIDMYADDTTLFYIGPSVDAVCDGLNRILGMYTIGVEIIS